MNLFNNMLKDSESLFRDEIALDYDYLSKLLPYREKEQFYMANCIKPLFQKRTGKNLLIHGPPGIGKTAATRHILRELDYETDEIAAIYVNCWKKNTSYKIAMDICQQLGCKFLQNKTKEELFELIRKNLNKRTAVFAFDEVDKLEDLDFLYILLEEINRKTIFLITNYKSWLNSMDERVKSRLTAEIFEFRQYNADETRGILKHRLGYAFVPGCWDNLAFETIAKKTFELKDIRLGLYLLREAAEIAEQSASKKITLEHANKALVKLDAFAIKKTDDLKDDTQMILELIKKNDNVKIGVLYEKYKTENGTLSYKSFQRRIKKLQQESFIEVKKTQGGEEGNTSIIKYNNFAKKLTDF